MCYTYLKYLNFLILYNERLTWLGDSSPHYKEHNTYRGITGIYPFNFIPYGIKPPEIIMNLFLRAKHWQLFLLMFVLPFICYVFIMINVFSSMMIHPQADPTTAFNSFKLLPLMLLIFMAVIFGWQWSIAIGLQKFIPEGIKMKTRLYKTFFFFPLVYMAIFLSFFVFAMSGFMSSLATNGSPAPAILGVFALIIPLHLFSMFCIIYCMYFAAKTIKTVELQRNVTFSEFVGEFFLIWFSIVGVWILQPKFNKLMATGSINPLDDFNN